MSHQGEFRLGCEPLYLNTTADTGKHVRNTGRMKNEPPVTDTYIIFFSKHDGDEPFVDLHTTNEQTSPEFCYLSLLFYYRSDEIPLKQN